MVNDIHNLGIQYLLLIFGLSLGVLQGVFALRRIEGMRFFHRDALSYAFAVIVCGGSLAWFYSAGDRNTLPVIEGSQQFGLFAAGAVAAALLTGFVASAVNRNRFPAPARTGYGVGCMANMTFWQYLRSAAGAVVRRGR